MLNCTKGAHEGARLLTHCGQLLLPWGAGPSQGDFDMPDPIDMDSGLQALMQMLEQGGGDSSGGGVDAFLQSMMRGGWV